MAALTWGDLLKSQVDDHTIIAAITAYIAEHNADETAHLGTGQSLQSHKASEIIDHLAESIISDKVALFQIYPEQLALKKAFYQTNFESLAFWTQAVSHGSILNNLGGVVLNVDNYVGATARLSATSIGGGSMEETLCVLEWVADVEFDYFDYDLLMGVGYYNAHGFAGFKVHNGKIYAYSRQYGGAETAIEIVGAGLPTGGSYKVVFTSSSSVEFYIDNALVGTITGQSWGGMFCFATFYLVNTVAGDTQKLVVPNLQFYRR